LGQAVGSEEAFAIDDEEWRPDQTVFERCIDGGRQARPT
jgi:hypothetical protein